MVATANDVYESIAQCATINDADIFRRFITLRKPANEMNAEALVPEQDIPYAQDRDLFLLFSHILLKIPINNERGETLYLSPLEKYHSFSG
jgi:hypothetical protein